MATKTKAKPKDGAKPLVKPAVQPLIPTLFVGQRPLTKKRTTSEVRRIARVAELWPNADAFVWKRNHEKGFTTIPRTLTLIATLINHLSERADASRVYFDLWCRAFDEGMVEVLDEDEHALSCGYEPSSRHKRTWQERIHLLEKLGFIAVRPKASRRIGFILLLHPHAVVAHLLKARPTEIPDWWLELFKTRLREIGAEPREADGVADFLETANGKMEVR